jgi:hypothetical protein
VSKKRQAAPKVSLGTNYKLQAAMTEPKIKSRKLQAWNSDLMRECKSLRLAFELEAHLLIIQQQRWFRKDKIETHLTLIPIGIGKEQKMLTTFFN